MIGDSVNRGNVWMGTTGWTDPTLARCGKFFPASSRTAEDRLRYYSTQFPCVEVDSSNYAIPPKSSVQRWLSCVPKGFVFHFKAFGFFCSKSCVYGALPYQIKNQIRCPADGTVQLSSLSESQKCQLWQIFNDALLPVHQAGSLGIVVFQFHLTFKPSDEHKSHIKWCRRNLDARFSMAVEFRCRDWFNQENACATDSWLTENCIALVAADELEHETYLKGRLTDSPMMAILPVAWSCTDPMFMYIRLHRREGTDRILASTELSTWEDRLKNKLPHNLKGPVYFLWGTMWEDQPVVNSRNLAQRLGDMVLDWKSIYLATSKSSLQRFFKARTSDAVNSVPRVSEIGEEMHNYTENINTSSGTTPGVADDDFTEEHAVSETPDTTHDYTLVADRAVQDAMATDDGVVGKDEPDGRQHGSSERVTSQFQKLSTPHRGPKRMNRQPTGSKRKENPSLRSSNITSFFKRASQ